MTNETLYYDGMCPVCAREMKHLAKRKRDRLDLVDIHQIDITNEMPSKEALLLNLHLKRGDEWLVGANANVAAWQHTLFGVLWAWLRWPVVKQFVDPVYAFWAKKRYDALYGAKPDKANRHP